MGAGMAADPWELTPAEAAGLRRELEQVWAALFGGPTSESLEDDLDRLSKWFGPRVRNASLRGLLESATPYTASAETLDFDPPLAIAAGTRTVITLEGRVALEQLREAEGDPESLRLAVKA